MIDPNAVVTYNFEPMSIKDIPSVSARAMLGYGHLVFPGDSVIPHPSGEPWPYTPETCLRTDEKRWTWINDGQSLVCPGCGLDGT